MNKYTYAPPCDKSTLAHLYLVDGKTYREIADILGVTVKPIRTAMRIFGITARPAIPRNQRGERNACWKGNKAGYAAFHRRLYAGQQNHCDVCGESDPNKRYEWANLTGHYEDPTDYKRMCCSCHHRHDGIISNIKRTA